MASRTPAVRSYKDLIVWQRAMDLAACTHEIAAGLSVVYRFSLAEQMHRAAISVVANIAEGAGRRQPGEYCHFAGIARGSLAELETLVLLGVRLNAIGQHDADTATALITETGKLLSGLIRRLRDT
jgi:four helix bundle protein